MKLDDDFDYEYNSYKGSNDGFKKDSSYIYTLAIVSVVILGIFVTVIGINKKNDKHYNNQYYQSAVSQAEADSDAQLAVEKSVDELISGSTLRAEDLDFWHDYDHENETVSVNSSANDITDYTSNNNATSSVSTNDPATDGKHTLITYSNGTEEWLEINPYLVLNTYNTANLVYSNGIMKYYDNHVNTSFTGVEISNIDDFVDYNKLRNAGVDFVMLRVGQRGYSTGEIMADESFQDNYDRARLAGLDVGVYFFSQATSKEEAEAEADFCLQTISGNEIKYPVVFYIEEVNSNDVRTSNVNQLLRTNLAISFMDRIRSAGYVPMVYGNKEYLLKKLSFGSLIGYDVWLGEEGDIPDFPYEYNMWKYTSVGRIDGINGAARMIISFTDYHSR